MNPKLLAEIMVAHRDEPAHLKAINQLFVSEGGRSLDEIAPTLKKVIRGLRRHMAEEEAELFPIFEQAFAGQQEEPAATREMRLDPATRPTASSRGLAHLVPSTALGARQDSTPRAEPVGLHEQMTVNRVVQQFPNTRPVFERLFINVPVEGCTCLDEVAWRHGMEAEDLLDVLEQAVSSCECLAGGRFVGAEDVESESETVQGHE